MWHLYFWRLDLATTKRGETNLFDLNLMYFYRCDNPPVFDCVLKHGF